MGFDVYGKNPQLVSTKPDIDWDTNPSDEERDKFFEDLNKFEEDNPGYYFRNNVWYWRPLWSYVCDYIAPDILSDEDKKGGEYNDHHHITAIKANYIAEKIADKHASGELQKFADWYKVSQDNLPKEKCDICDGSGVRNDQYVKGKCNACEDGMKDSFAKSYPFDIDNVIEFGKFCKASGGFEIG